ncbi:MAG: hypothetical protein ACRC5H_07520 [Treponemataceae bacterium]
MKNRWIVFIALGLCFTVSLILLLPQVRSFIVLDILEGIRSKEIKREFWMNEIAKIAFIGCFLCISASILLLSQKKIFAFLAQ